MSQHLTLKKVRENLDPSEQSLFDRFLASARAHSAEATYPAPRRRGEIDAALLTAPVTVTQGEAMESESPNIAEPPEKESVNMSTSDTVPTTSATNPTTNNAASPPNVITFDKLLAIATQLGAEAGKGKDTQIKFYVSVSEAAYHGKIDLTANKHGPGIDDAVKLTEAYVKAQTGSTIFDHKAPNQRKAASCVRTSIVMGGQTKWGPNEPVAIINRWLTVRAKLRASLNAPKLDDAANTFMRLCRTQIKRDSLLTDAELQALCLKKNAEEQTEEQYLETLRKKLLNLKAGKGGPKVDSKAAADMINCCTRRLTEIAKAKGETKGETKSLPAPVATTAVQETA